MQASWTVAFCRQTINQAGEAVLRNIVRKAAGLNPRQQQRLRERHICGDKEVRYARVARGSKCYLPAAHGHRARPLLPLLTELTQEGAASTFVAMGFLGLIEVALRLDYLRFL